MNEKEAQIIANAIYCLAFILAMSLAGISCSVSAIARSLAGAL